MNVIFRMAEEEIRRKEMERLQQMKEREQEILMRQKQEFTSSNVELKYYNTEAARPGEQHGFGFGNVRTGQVSTKKMTFLTRASSAGPADRADLNPDIMAIRTTSSARASPMPFGQAEFTTAPSMAVGLKAGADDLVQVCMSLIIISFYIFSSTHILDKLAGTEMPD